MPAAANLLTNGDIELGGRAWDRAETLPWLPVDALVHDAFLREEAALLESECERFILGLVVLDYLQLMSGPAASRTGCRRSAR